MPRLEQVRATASAKSTRKFIPTVNVWGAVASVVAVLAVLLWGTTTQGYLLFAVTVFMTHVLTVAGLNILFGFAGEVSLGHGVFYGIGAYATALGLLYTSYSLFVVVAASVIMVTLVSAILVVPTLRISGVFLAMVTLAYALLFSVILVNWEEVTGGPLGLSLSPVRDRVPDLAYLFVATTVTAAFALWMTHRIKKSALGRGLRALRDGKASAASLGVPVTRYKVIAFVFSAAVAGLAGSYYALAIGYITPSDYDPMFSVSLLVALVVGGSGYVLGPVYGSAILVLGPELFHWMGEYEPILVGLLLLFFIVFLSGGVAGALDALRRITAAPLVHSVRRLRTREIRSGKDGR